MSVLNELGSLQIIWQHLFSQLVNGFCKQKDSELKMKVMTRLQNITYLQALLEKVLAGMLFVFLKKNFLKPYYALDPSIPSLILSIHSFT